MLLILNERLARCNNPSETGTRRREENGRSTRLLEEELVTREINQVGGYYDQYGGCHSEEYLSHFWFEIFHKTLAWSHLKFGSVPGFFVVSRSHSQNVTVTKQTTIGILWLKRMTHACLWGEIGHKALTRTYPPVDAPVFYVENLHMD